MTVILLTTALGGSVAGGAWALARMLQEPDGHLPPTTAGDSLRAQQKVFEIARSRARSATVVLSEGELNGFLSRHLAEAAELPLAGIGVRLVGRDVIEFAGRVPFRSILSEPPLTAVRDLVPGRWLDRPVWLQLHARVRVEHGAAKERRRYLRLDVDRFAVGKQRLPVVLLRLLLSPATLHVFRWRLPDPVESVTIETGRVVIRTAS